MEKATNSENNQGSYFWNIKMCFNPLTWGRGSSYRNVMGMLFETSDKR